MPILTISTKHSNRKTNKSNQARKEIKGIQLKKKEPKLFLLQKTNYIEKNLKTPPNITVKITKFSKVIDTKK